MHLESVSPISLVSLDPVRVTLKTGYHTVGQTATNSWLRPTFINYLSVLVP